MFFWNTAEAAAPTVLPSPTPLPVETSVPVPEPTATPTPVASTVEVRITSVAVTPPEVRAGRQVRLVIAYDLLGVPSETAVEVVETRRIMSGSTVLATFSETLRQDAGAYTSELPVRVPSSLEPGVYSLEALVAVVGGATRKGSGVLRVLSDVD